MKAQQLRVGPERGTCSFKGDLELWSRFKQTCKTRGVSICHVLEALEEAWIQGQKAEATLVRPVVVNLTMQHVVERPRRKALGLDPRIQTWPPSCMHADAFLKASKEVGCTEIKEWIPLPKCWRCWLAGGPQRPT